jgi:two-component system sensor histidine kinase UhpB
MKLDSQTLKVTVTDNGIGLNADTVRGFGLIGMRERVSALGGRIAFDTEEGHGLQVRVLIPLGDDNGNKQ